MRRFYFLFLLGFLFGASPSMAAWQKGQVVLDGAMVYEKADFDSPVIAYLAAGKIFLISDRTFGPFYQIALDKQTMGFISDIDVKPSKGRGGRKKKGSLGESPTEDKAKDPEVEEIKSGFDEAKFAGVSYSVFNFTESTLGLKFSESLGFYGFKLTGTDVLLPGGQMDFNFYYHSGAPKQYAIYSGWPSTGKIFLVDLNFIYQSLLSPSTMVYWGAGPMLHYSQYQVYYREGTGEPFVLNLVDSRLFPVLEAGLAVRMGSVALRFEGKYVYDRTPYVGGGASLQVEY